MKNPTKKGEPRPLTFCTDRVRHVVLCIAKPPPYSPPPANYTGKCFAREREGQTPTTVNLTPPPPLHCAPPKHTTSNSSYASNA